MRINRMSVLAATATVIGCFSGSPANAQLDPYYWTPVVGPINTMELQLAQEMVSAYNNGMLTPQEYADFRRDFDGMKNQEELYRLSERDLYEWPAKRVTRFYERFRNELRSHYADRKSPHAHK